MTDQNPIPPGLRAAREEVRQANSSALRAALAGASMSPVALLEVADAEAPVRDPVARTILAQFRDFVADTSKGQCAHYPTENGPDTIWWPGAPMLCCPECALPLVVAIQDTPFNWTCDLCGKVHPKDTIMNQRTMTLEGTVTPEGRKIWPVTIMFAHCLGGCQT